MACPGGAPWEWQSRGGPGSPVLTSDLHGWDVQAADSQSAKLLPSCSEMVTVAAHTLTRQFPCHGEKPPAFHTGSSVCLGEGEMPTRVLESRKAGRGLCHLTCCSICLCCECALESHWGSTCFRLYWLSAESSHALLTNSSMSSSC